MGNIILGEDIKKELESREMPSSQKIDQILEYSRKAAEASEKTRKYFLWSSVIQIIVIFLPIIALLIIIPFVLSSFSSLYQGLL